MSRYVEMLLEVNRHVNLTAVRDPVEVWPRHVFDSLFALKRIKADRGQRAMDLGSGGGLPGIPLAVCLPDMEWTLVDSVGKKARFLETVARELDLENVRVLNVRAEELARDPAYRGGYHLITARAVARLPALLELAIPLLRVKGRFLAMKGEQAPQELAESMQTCKRLHVLHRETVPTPGGGNLLVLKRMGAGKAEMGR